MPEMEKALKKECLACNLAACEIVPAQLGEEIGNVAALSVGVVGLEELKNVR